MYISKRLEGYVKISKDIFWLKEYIDSICYLLPELKNLKRITSKVPNKNLNENQSCHGIITKYKYSGECRITIYTKYLDMRLVKGEVELKILPYSKIDTLCYIAHELSHLREWEHTTSHKTLEANIISIFMNILSKNGYISEEDEPGINANCRKKGNR